MRFLHIHAITALALSAVSLSGCMLTDMKKNMDEMHDATVSMNNKMDDTNKGMTTTNKGMGDTVYATGVTRNGLKKSASADLRMKAYGEMDAAKEIKTKLEAATAYMYALEFQAWDAKMETEEDRQYQMKEAMAEIFKKVADSATDKNKVSPTKMSNDWKNAYAIVGALHRVNSLQTLNAKKFNYQVYSALDLISSGLEACGRVNRGEVTESQIEMYQLEVCREIKTAVWMLRVRHNFLNAYAFVLMDKSTNGNDPGLFEKLWRIVGDGIFGIDWKPTLKYMDTNELNYAATVLEYSQATRVILRENGFDPMRTGSIIKIFRNIDWKKAEAETPSPTVLGTGGNYSGALGDVGAGTRAAALDRLKTAVNDIIAE